MLTPDQIAARKDKLTASRIACLMRGDVPAIFRLYQEMTGAAAEDDLAHVWPVRLGEATEALNLDWYEMKNGPLTRRREVVAHPRLDWATATLDGWDPVLACPIEAKHVAGREPLEVVIDRYQPQMQWQMECTSAAQCALSVIVGANAPVVEFIPRDEPYAALMRARGAQFIDFVRRGVAPVALPPIAPPVDATKVFDMTGNNRWADDAATWLATKPAAERCDDASARLKTLVPPEAKKCHGHGIQITRDRAGRLSLRSAQ